jgi:hypothetical protein
LDSPASEPWKEFLWLRASLQGGVTQLLAVEKTIFFYAAFPAMYITTVSALYIEEWRHEKGGSVEGREIIIHP